MLSNLVKAYDSMTYYEISSILILILPYVSTIHRFISCEKHATPVL